MNVGAHLAFDFGLKFRISADANPSEIIERLAEAGCDDAVIGTGRPGLLALDFSREAASVEEAISSALADVKRAVPGAELVQISNHRGNDANRLCRA